VRQKHCFICWSAKHLAYFKILVVRLEVNGENKDFSWRAESDGKYAIQFSVLSMNREVFSFRAIILVEREGI
jgi:hypothetical protein